MALMATSPILAALLGVIAAAGLLAAADSLRTRTRPRSSPILSRWSRRTHIQAAICVPAGLLAWAATGWPVAGIAVAVAVLTLPKLLSAGTDAQTEIAKLEAIATWTESLANNLAAAAGIEQSILVASINPPEAIATSVTALATALQQRTPLTTALADLRDELADPIADLVIAQLTVASDAPAGRLAATLSTIAGIARTHVTQRLDIEADRAPVRTELRLVLTLTVVLVGGLKLLRPQFLVAYGHPLGEMVLFAVGGIFALGLAMMTAMGRDAQPPRVLTGPHPSDIAGVRR
jgi:hypothetical protein